MERDDSGMPPGESRLETFLLDSAARPRRTGRWLPRAFFLLLLGGLLSGAWWSREPAAVDVPALAQESGTHGNVPGAVSTTTLIATWRTLLDKSGGLIANDMLPPGMLLDDMPAFENGALAEARTFLRALRRDFSRAETQSAEDADLLRAEPRLLFDSGSWLMPSAESEYEEGLAALGSYRERLLQSGTPGAQFHPRADGLTRWLDDVGADLDAQTAQLAQARAASWADIDDRFYRARGYCWALRSQLQAVRLDFADALRAHGDADAQLAAAIDALDGTQSRISSPLILSGSEYGVLANHPLVMAGYVSRAAAALRRVQDRLDDAPP